MKDYIVSYYDDDIDDDNHYIAYGCENEKEALSKFVQYMHDGGNSYKYNAWAKASPSLGLKDAIELYHGLFLDVYGYKITHIHVLGSRVI